MTPITVDTPVADTITVDGIKEYEVTIPAPGKYVVELGGTANVLFGLWEGDFLPRNGRLRICGISRRGCRMLTATKYVIRVTGNSAGDFTFLVRAWSIWDYFTINFYKSTC